MDNREKLQREDNLRENANTLSLLSFAWLYDIFRLGYERDLDTADLYSCLQEDRSQTLGHHVSETWVEEEKKFKNNNIQKPNLLKVLAKCFGKKLILLGLGQAVNEIFLVTFSVVLFTKVLSYFNNKSEMSKTEAYCWASGFLVCQFLSGIIGNLCVQAGMHIDLKLRISCSALVYRKCLKISKASAENNNVTIGQIINVLSNDVGNVDRLSHTLNYIWIAPIQAITVAVIIYYNMNLYSFVGTLFIFMIVHLQGYLGKWMKKLSLQKSLWTDKRLSLMSDIISGVQVIKMCAWEKTFSHLVDKARSNEMSVIRKMAFIDAITICFEVSTPRLCVFFIILFYAMFEHHISGKQVYMITAFYNVLKFSVNTMMALATQRLSKALASIRRFEEIMLRQEIYHFIANNVEIHNIDPNIAVRIGKSSAKWSPEMKKNTIYNMNFIAQRSSLSAVIGQVGSGKSSLLYLILDELPVSSGSIQVSGTIAYVSQEPWVFPSSVKQNILFGLPTDKERYQEVIKICQLEEDFFKFPFGDETLIGEKGITLSGGQKSRINLARAVYRDADIYLLDDPLSAVDTQVGRRIFDDCICNYLKQKTRIMVTHQLQYLKSVDRIFVLNNGSVEIEATFEELHTSGLDLKILPVTDDYEANNKKSSNDVSKDLGTLREQNFEHKQEEVPEHRTVGKTSGSVYLSYVKAAGSVWIVFIVLSLGIFYQAVATYGDIFLSRWVNTLDKRHDSSSHDIDTIWNLKTYFLLTLAMIVLANIFFLSFAEMCVRSSKNLHNLMFYSIMRTTMSFFYENPSGRILNRFSKDIGAVDMGLPEIMGGIAQVALLLCAVIVINIYVNPWLLLPIIVMGSLFYILRVIYMRTSRSLKRLEAITRSPVLSHVTATLQGLTTVRSLKAEQKLTEEFDNYQNLNSSASYLFFSCGSAFTFYSHIITTLYTIVMVFLFVSMSSKISVGDAGLAITQCTLFAFMLQWGLKQTVQMENQITSVERIIAYIDLKKEPPLKSKPENKPPTEWPSAGRVEFRDVSLIYKPSGVLALKNINFVVLPEEKVGIVGRTGAGKSSLITALFRLGYLKGEIYIDDVATSKLGLHDVRSNISLIPQEPLLFAGSLRRNLDPLEQYSDDELWQALAEVELKIFIMKLYAGLDAKVSDGGSNFSLGQRQLLCLARAIVRNKKILVLDEATANVDLQSDELIQKTIRRKFKDCTVFIIAHRLKTVMDCDKFIVMDSGSMVEFGHPYEILRKKEGFLYNMVQQTGPEMAEVLTKMAENAHQQ